MDPTRLKICTKKEIKLLNKKWKSEGHKIVFTNGCFDIIHLAVHGIGDTTNAIDSRLIFKTSPDMIDDGNLFAHELYNIRFRNPRLAVLSACETGIGKEAEYKKLLQVLTF